MSAQLKITDVGRQVALSGLLPITANDLLTYLVNRRNDLVSMLPDQESKRDRQGFDFCILNACLSSPEFVGATATRFLPYQLDYMVTNDYAEKYSNFLKEPVWQANRSAANAAALLIDWIDGARMRDLEGSLPDLRAGKIQGLAKEIVWCLDGITEILAAATRLELTPKERPLQLRELLSQDLLLLRKILPALRLVTWRLSTGLPEDILWMSELRNSAGHTAVNRREALALYHAGLFSYTDLRQRNNWKDFIQALVDAGVPHANQRALEIRQYADDWHVKIRKRTCKKLQSQSSDFSKEIEAFFNSRDRAFESNFEQLLKIAGISYTLFDDGSKPGAFDYLIHIENRPDFALECKTRQGNSLVDLGSASKILSATEIHSHANKFCVTLCNTGVNPDILPSLATCDRLGIVETHDMAIALVRVINGKLSPQGFHDWLTQPGLVKAENLYAYGKRAIDTVGVDISTPGLNTAT